MTLRDLLERVERATGPDRELDRAIWKACGIDYRQSVTQPITESVDAALALIGRVLPEWWWTVGQSAPTGFASATVARKGGTVRSVSAPTPALALCAALLAALIEQENTNG